MSRYYNAKDVEIALVFSGLCDGKTCKEVREVLNSIPTIDRPQGEWLKFGLGRGTRILFCTNCERKIEVPLSQGDSNYNFCPNCGAKMKGADDETNHRNN